MDIDSNIVDLVDALNAFPGIFTFSSCGGDDNPNTVSQSPPGEFYVDFEVDPLRGGWRSLQLISHAARSGSGDVHIKVWQCGDEPETMSFKLSGGADPAELAVALEDVLDWYNANPPFVYDDDDAPEAT
jgi:hypothetical protein